MRGVCRKCYQLLWYHKQRSRVTEQELMEVGALAAPFSTPNSPARQMLAKVLGRKHRKQNAKQEVPSTWMQGTG